MTDTTGTLSAEAKQDLDTRLAAIETQKGSQVVILLLPSTQPEDIAAYGIRVADAWKIGRKGVDDGIILLVALQDHKLRIEVGRGLEGALPDAIAKRIIAEDITPYFKQGDIPGGLAAGVSRIAERVGAEPLPSPKNQIDQQDPDPLDNWMVILFILVFVGVMILKSFIGTSRGLYSSRRSSLPGSILPGSFGGGTNWGGGSSGGFDGGGGGFGGGGASGGW